MKICSFGYFCELTFTLHFVPPQCSSCSTAVLMDTSVLGYLNCFILEVNVTLLQPVKLSLIFININSKWPSGCWKIPLGFSGVLLLPVGNLRPSWFSNLQFPYCNWANDPASPSSLEFEILFVIECLVHFWWGFYGF